jgi:lysophospholipase L1-like esterase
MGNFGARILPLIILCFTFLAAPRAADHAFAIDASTRLAFFGDSITEQKLYARFIEAYLVAVAPTVPQEVFNFGVGGAGALGSSRLFPNDLAFFAPNLVTTCYGMNDGRYRIYNPDDGKQYREGMERFVKESLAADVAILVGGPGAVDSTRFKREVSPDDYNATLQQLSAIAKEVADANGVPFVDVHGVCIEAMAKAKAALGADYIVMGADGIHPGQNGHLAMAFAFLKEMGFSGDVGTITLDLAKNIASATGAHQITAKDECYEIVSSRWIFCFTGNPANPRDESTLAMMPFVPFNKTLNRFTLKVAGLTAPEAEVQWGAEKLRFTQAELAQGINLAEKFAGKTPFQAGWKKLDEALDIKQSFEGMMIKQIIFAMNNVTKRYLPDDTELKNEFASLLEKLKERHRNFSITLSDIVTPITHELRVSEITN